LLNAHLNLLVQLNLMLRLLSRSALDAVSNPLAIKNPDGVVLRCNLAFQDLLGLPSDGILGKTVFEYLPSGDAQLHHQVDRRLIDLREPECAYQAELNIHPSKRVLDIYKTSIREGSEEIKGLVLIVTRQAFKKIEAISLDILLTARERDVLSHILQGSSQKRIGVSLGISHHTVNDHLKSIYSKLGVKSRAQAQYVAMTKFKCS
jgi:PAS domain S-box-containing protein